MIENIADNLSTNKSISCSNIPEAFLDKNITKKHFSQFGRIHSFVLRPKRFTCSVEYETAEEARNALNFGGSYDGITFNIMYTPKEKPNMDFIDPDVQSELEAMAGKPGLVLNRLGDFEMKKPTIPHEPLKRQILRPKPVVEVTNPPKAMLNVDLTTKIELETIMRKQALSSLDKFKVLDARDKLIRLTTSFTKDIKKAVSTKGICPDMCPEKERLMREAKHQVASFELEEFSKNVMKHTHAIKQYSRSSADQESPLLHDLRPEPVLQMTMNYLLHKIADLCDSPDVGISDWFHFIWDRTRSIRKDITQQELCSQGVVALVEQCARLHIHCAARLVAEEPQVFDQKINTENLTKCLQTLKYMYHDLRLKGEKCENESEFRAYIVLLNLHDSNFLWEIKQLPPNIKHSPEVQFAIKVYQALEGNNYVKFFKLVRETSYLNACILLRYFIQVRVKALNIIMKAYVLRGPVAMSISYWTYQLGFESEDQCVQFLEYYGMQCDQSDDRVTLDRNTFFYPDVPFFLERAINLVEHKRTCSVGEVIRGAPLDSLDEFVRHEPHDSFDENGYLIEEAWTAEDQNYYKPPTPKQRKATHSPFNEQSSNVFKMPLPPSIQSKTQQLPKPSIFTKLSPKTNVELTSSVSSQSIFSSQPSEPSATSSGFSADSFIKPPTTSGNIFTNMSGKSMFGASVFGQPTDEFSKNIFQMGPPKDSTTSETSKNIFQMPTKPVATSSGSSGSSGAPLFGKTSFQSNKAAFTSDQAKPASSASLFSFKSSVSLAQSTSSATSISTPRSMFQFPTSAINDPQIDEQFEKKRKAIAPVPTRIFEKLENKQDSTNIFGQFQQDSPGRMSSNSSSSASASPQTSFVNLTSNLGGFSGKIADIVPLQTTSSTVKADATNPGNKFQDEKNKAELELKRKADLEQQKRFQEQRDAELEVKRQLELEMKKVREMEQKKRKAEEKQKKLEELERKQKEERQKRIELKKKREKISETASAMILKEIVEQHIADEIKAKASMEINRIKVLNDQSKTELNKLLDISIDELVKQFANEAYEEMLQERRDRNIKNIENTPIWLPETSIVDQVPEMQHPSQHFNLQLQKRYRNGVPDKIHLPSSINRRVDVFDLVPSEIPKRDFSSKFISRMMYWKCVISVPDTDEDNLFSRVDKWLNESLIRRSTKNPEIFFCEQYRLPQVQQGFSICLRKLVGSKMINETGISSSNIVCDTNATIFFVSTAGLRKSKKRLEVILQNATVNNVIAVVLYNTNTQFNLDHIQMELDLEKLISKSVNPNQRFEYFCDPTQASLTNLFESSLRYAASEYKFKSQLEMQPTSSILAECLCDQFWTRIKTSARYNPGLGKSVMDPNFVIKLYNSAIDRITSICTNDNIDSHSNFPEEFQEFIKKVDLDIPLGYEYFPKDWKSSKRRIQLQNFLSTLRLQPLKIDLTNIPTLEKCILVYCNNVIGTLSDAERTAYRMIESILKYLQQSPVDIIQSLECQMNNFNWIEPIKLLTIDVLSYQYNEYHSFLPPEIIYDKDDLTQYTSELWWLQSNGLLKNVRVSLDGANLTESGSAESMVKRPRINNIENIELDTILARSAACLEKADRKISKYQSMIKSRKEMTLEFDQLLYTQEKAARNLKRTLRMSFE